METILDRAGRTAESIRLTTAEKSAMRTALLERLARPASVSWFSRARGAAISSFAGLQVAFRAVSRPALAFTALAGLAAIGSGTVVAAEKSLPGQPLYSIKVGVTEPVRRVLAVTPEAKTRWSVEVVNRRLDEAEQLQAAGQLDDEKRGEVESRLKRNVAEATRNVSDLGRNESLPAAAAAIGSDLEASLRGHGRRLGRVKTADKKSKEHADSVASVAAQAADQAADVRGEEERSMTGATAVPRAAVVARIAAVERRIGKVRGRLDGDVRSLNGDDVAAASVKLDEAEKSLAAGRDKMRAGDLSSAFTMVQAADRAAQEAQMLVLPSKTRKENTGGEEVRGHDRTQRSSPETNGRNPDRQD